MKYKLVRLDWVENSKRGLHILHECVGRGLEKEVAQTLQAEMENNFPECSFLVLEEVE